MVCFPFEHLELNMSAVASVRNFIGSLFLAELFKGLALTGRHLFARKITIQFPE